MCVCVRVELRGAQHTPFLSNSPGRRSTRLLYNFWYTMLDSYHYGIIFSRDSQDRNLVRTISRKPRKTIPLNTTAKIPLVTRLLQLNNRQIPYPNPPPKETQSKPKNQIVKTRTKIPNTHRSSSPTHPSIHDFTKMPSHQVA